MGVARVRARVAASKAPGSLDPRELDRGLARGSPRRSAPLEGTRLCSRRSPWSPPALGCRSLHLNAPAHTTSNSATSVTCVSVKTLRFDSRARNKCLPRILASSHDDCNLHRTVTRAGTDAPRRSRFVNPGWAPKTFELRMISVGSTCIHRPVIFRSVKGRENYADQMPIAHIFRMVEQFEVRMTKSYFSSRRDNVSTTEIGKRRQPGSTDVAQCWARRWRARRVEKAQARR